ncbi:hypothetical protein GRF29_44g1616667 [Pseudopithomyces chartarum]|uniref:GDP-mannose transporter n=1 Tax=Pseudopithomyces chartarum TaxID=1892770 RepID=A0AAN6RK11_9PLEO|nr:hypothetical protein GRF29_44g1616667 [Pseudopithomyces chartarum]
MNASRPFTRTANTIFRPAFSYLNNIARESPTHPDPYRHNLRRKNSASSLDDTDHSDVDQQYAQMDTARPAHSTKSSLSELQPAMPLIDISSRSTSPYPRSRSAAQSEDEDDDFEPADSDSIRPLVNNRLARGASMSRGVWREGGLGGFFFGTWMGWQVYVALLVFWVGGCGFGLLLMNRFIMLTGVFPFPLTGTYLQLLLTHILLIAFSTLTRGLANPLRRLGLGAAIAPAFPVAPIGTAGGGFFEFDPQVAKQVLPLAVVFCFKVLLSNVSFAYATLPVYQLARIPVVPLALIFSAIIQKESHSSSTLSSALIATLFLSFASYRSHQRVTPDSIVAGVFSSIFVALFPIMLLRTYRTLVSNLVPQGDVLTGYPSSADDHDSSSNREETRAYYRVLHYTSLLSIILLSPIVLFSGGIPHIIRNIPFLDVPFFWLMIWCGALGSFAVFASTFTKERIPIGHVESVQDA